jgi:competence protein ComEC
MNKVLRLPLIPILFAYALGLYLGHFDLPFSIRGFIFLILILLVSWAILIGIKKRLSGSWVAFALFLLLGTFSIHHYLHPHLSPYHLSHYTGLDRISLEGIVDRAPQRAQGQTQLLIRAEKAILSNQCLPVEGHLLLFLKEEPIPFHLGDRLRFLCRLYPPHGFHNPGGFSYERHLAFERILTIAFLSDGNLCVKIGEGYKNPILVQIEEWRDHIRNFLEREAHFPSSSLFKALILGEQGDIPEELKEHFIVTGIAHLLAISGDHLGIVALLSFSLLIWTLKRSEFLLLSVSVKKLAAGLTIPCILLYMFIAGGGISVIRATIMVITFFLSILFNRERNLLHTLALAAFLILLFSPPSLFDVSFQLSFLSVLSILYLVPPILQWLKGERTSPPIKTSWRQSLLKYAKLSLLATAVAILGTAPFVALHFNRISPIGFLTNLFFIPWVGFLIVPLGLLASLLSFLSYPVAAIFLHINEFFTVPLIKTVAFFASFPFASIFVSTPTVLEIILFYALLFSVIYFQKSSRAGTTAVPTPGHRRKMIRYLSIGVCIALLSDSVFWNVRPHFQKKLIFTFIDVGYGDSILLEFPGGKKMLIDGGGLQEDRFDTGKNVVAPLLWKRKIRRLDYLVLTHPDPDHLKGLNFIASHFSIGQFWESGVRTDSEPYLTLKDHLFKKRIKIISLNEKSPPRVINGARISFLNPPAGVSAHAKKAGPFSLNNHSLVMKIQFKAVGILLPGDAEKEAEYRMLGGGYPLNADILKIPHHGSSSSSTLHFLQRVMPSCAILSVGERNIRRLPHPEVLKRYERLGTKIFRTDRHGAIRVVTDGDSVKVIPFVKDKP